MKIKEFAPKVENYKQFWRKAIKAEARASGKGAENNAKCGLVVE